MQADQQIVPGRFVHRYTVTDGKLARFEQVVDCSSVNEALRLEVGLQPTSEIAVV